MTEVRLTDDVDTCLKIRRAVFIDEQGVSEAEEMDGKDGEATHLLAFVDGTALGTARIFFVGDKGKIGRVAVLKHARGTGLGKALIEAAVAHIDQKGLRRVTLSAQVSALVFYERLGFHAVGPEFDDAGIPHREMVRDL